MMSLWHVSWLSYFLMFPIFMIFMVAAFEFANYMIFEGKWWVKVASKIFNFVGALDCFTIYVYGIPSCFGKLMFSTEVDELCLGFIEFEASQASVHDLMSSMEFCIIVMVLSSSVCTELLFVFGFGTVGLNDFLIEWSSAKPFRVNDFGTISLSVDA